ncbi:hypothetical protein HJC04_11335 [Rhizobium sp. NLR8a]|uniref:hypothetical protein n=1 Tax=Rhizobium TaxID=379 RepID=UPI001C828B5E|nr:MULTISPECIES: hypothetical protein [Rhizobium]MBX5153221.1 hypothetical protein [Rhizobium lentis]MBX5220894.1 hypothetical protein [Rhizobium sp. NLR8a]
MLKHISHRYFAVGAPLNNFHAAKARYNQNRFDACHKAVTNLRGVIGVEFHISDLSRGALEAVNSQWGSSEFDWQRIHDVYREPDCIKVAFWVGERLCALAIGTTSGQSLRFRFLEGSPDPNCPLKGVRILIALEVMALYGQMRGKRELVLEPINEKLIDVYENTYGFEVVRPAKGTAFCKKGI